MDEKWIFLIAGAAVGSINNLVFSQAKRTIYLCGIRDHLRKIVDSSIENLYAEEASLKKLRNELNSPTDQNQPLKRIGVIQELNDLDKIPLSDLFATYGDNYITLIEVVRYRNYFSKFGTKSVMEELLNMQKADPSKMSTAKKKAVETIDVRLIELEHVLKLSSKIMDYKRSWVTLLIK